MQITVKPLVNNTDVIICHFAPSLTKVNRVGISVGTKVNLKDFSKLLGLSPTTVSRALNGYPEVNIKTRERVEAAAREHGYAPNPTAKQLALGRAMAIGHILPITNLDMVNPLFSDFLAGAGEVYSERGYDFHISITPEGKEAETYRSYARHRKVDGVIVHAPRNDDTRIPLLQEIGLPFLVHGRIDPQDASYTWVDIDNRRAFDKATRYLTDLGHRRIALLNGKETMNFAQRRRVGYEDALKAAGIAVDPNLVFAGEMSEPLGHAAAVGMLAGENPPTAFLCSSFLIALGVQRAVTEAGKTLGHDVSVITHDDGLSFLPNAGEIPMFTATRSSIREAGHRCAEMLIDQIEGKCKTPAHELWEAELVVGRSTGPAP